MHHPKPHRISNVLDLQVSLKYKRTEHPIFYFLQEWPYLFGMASSANVSVHVADRKFEVRITNIRVVRVSFVPKVAQLFLRNQFCIFIFLRCELVANLDLAVSKVLACSTVREAWQNRGLDY